MPAAAPLPVRVLCKGGSIVTWSSWMGGARDELAYPRALEQRLRSQGHDVETRVTAMAAERATASLRRWEHEVAGFSPDVIVLHYGHVESIHAFVPRWLERHVRDQRGRPGRLREAYRSVLLQPVYKAVVKLQQQVDRRLPARTFGRRPRRTTAVLRRYIDNVTQFGRPLVLVVGMIPAGPPWRSWFPGIAGRLPVMDAALRAMVDDVGADHVRFVPLWDLAQSWLDEGREPTPDGGHFTPEFHRLVADRLAEAAADWLARQPHLRPGPASS